MPVLDVKMIFTILVGRTVMEWELGMPCEIGRSLEYRISYTIYTRLSCLLLFVCATN
jgi:hypothetical protein